LQDVLKKDVLLDNLIVRMSYGDLHFGFRIHAAANEDLAGDGHVGHGAFFVKGIWL